MTLSDDRKQWPILTCDSCNQRIVVGFIVPDEIWHAVDPPSHDYCLACFDALAQSKGVRYAATDLCAVSWSQYLFDEPKPSRA